MNHIIKQFLINSIKNLPSEILNIIKDYIFLSNIEQFIKDHKINQKIKDSMNISHYYIIQRPLLGYEIYYAEESEFEYYFPYIHNCNNCGEYLVNKKSDTRKNYVPLKIRCFCKDKKHLSI
jgi:hypothetical protein